MKANTLLVLFFAGLVVAGLGTAVATAEEAAVKAGIDMETTVSDSYNRATSEFTGTIDKVTITLK